MAASYRLILARDLCYLGRLEEAEPLRRQAQAVPAGPVERALGLYVQALLLAGQGELREAEALARVGVAAAETETDNLWLQGWGYEDLATMLERAGRIDETRDELERALALWKRKRCLPYVDRVRRQIDSLGRRRSDHMKSKAPVFCRRRRSRRKGSAGSSTVVQGDWTSERRGR